MQGRLALWGAEGWGHGGICSALPSDGSASGEAEAQPQDDGTSAPSGCSLSSKRPSLHGAGKTRVPYGQELSTRVHMDSLGTAA